jgi:hypothetical protein
MPDDSRHTITALQIARDDTVRIDGLAYRCQPWGIINQALFAPVFLKFARRREVHESAEFLYDVSKDPHVLVKHLPMSADRRAYYYRKYLEDSAVDWDNPAADVLTLNLSSSMRHTACDVFGPNAAGNTGLERPLLLRIALEMNAALLANNIIKDFRKSPEFGEYHARNSAKNGPRGPDGKLKLPQHHGHKVVRFG